MVSGNSRRNSAERERHPAAGRDDRVFLKRDASHNVARAEASDSLSWFRGLGILVLLG